VIPVALTIAGLDPSGGAGVIADTRTFAAFGCWPTAAITSLTFQNKTAVFGAQHLSAETVRAQLMPLVEEHSVACAKTGMLPTREIVLEVARSFRETNLPAPVVDPVMRSTSGFALMDDDAFESLMSDLLPLARLVTPNIPEAERITGLHIDDEEGMRRAAQALRELGARAVLIKGGHLPWQRSEVRDQRSDAAAPGFAVGGREKREAIDVLDDEGKVSVFRGEWIETVEVHGTGCSLSAAIAACLGKRLTLEESVGQAKEFVAAAIRSSKAMRQTGS
jgi:hydroxymethylpyrimidine kinase/phosphomethylpyrimidine kinase